MLIPDFGALISLVYVTHLASRSGHRPRPLPGKKFFERNSPKNPASGRFFGTSSYATAAGSRRFCLQQAQQSLRQISQMVEQLGIHLGARVNPAAISMQRGTFLSAWAKHIPTEEQQRADEMKSCNHREQS